MSLRIKLLAALGVATLTAVILIVWREFPPRLGLLAAIAVGALCFHAIGTATRLRRIHGRPRSGAAVDEDSPDSK